MWRSQDLLNNIVSPEATLSTRNRDRKFHETMDS